MPDTSTPIRTDLLLERALIACGFIFSAISVVALGYGLFLVIRVSNVAAVMSAGSEWSAAKIIANNFDLIATILIALLAAVIASTFFRSAGRSTNYVIRPEDREKLWPLITEPKVDAVDQYIRLASLSGFSGAFTKVGFTGLPLATVILTLIFVVLSLLTDNTDLMELAKLTLGAFIGSFVQRQVERGERQQPGPGGAQTPQAPLSSAPRLPV